MEYVALLRGINVGGKNKVVMGELRRQVEDMGCADVRSYINSGNVLFETDAPEPEISRAFAAMLKERYPFPIRLAILSREDYLSEVPDLPTWWSEPIAATCCSSHVRWTHSMHVDASSPCRWATSRYILGGTWCSGASLASQST